MAHIMYLIANFQSQNTHIIAFPKFLVLKSCFKKYKSINFVILSRLLLIMSKVDIFYISKLIYINSRFLNILRWRLCVILYMIWLKRKEMKLYIKCVILQVISHQKLKNMEFHEKNLIHDFLFNFANVKVIYFDS